MGCLDFIFLFLKHEDKAFLFCCSDKEQEESETEKRRRQMGQER